MDAGPVGPTSLVNSDSGAGGLLVALGFDGALASAGALVALTSSFCWFLCFQKQESTAAVLAGECSYASNFAIKS